ncbi:MAG: glycosyltransferase family 1 protein [Burkholderiaceae bacterium]|nr:glycosyltransferase family 1 protein [Burkholderiaceae bacterium]
MTHFGVIAPAFYSHFNALEALANGLMARGHRVTFFQQVDAQKWISEKPIDFHELGAVSHPAGSLAAVIRRAAQPGLLGIRKIIADMAAASDMLCRELPSALTASGIDALLCDQMEGAGGLVAQALKMPYVSIACALPINRADDIPLSVMPFGYAATPRARSMYRHSANVYDWFMHPHARVLREHACRLGLVPSGRLDDWLSPAAQISQSLPEFEFTTRTPFTGLHHVGPLRASGDGTSEALPDDIDPARPFVFVSLGTLQGGRLRLLCRIARGCRLAGVQALVAHCGRLSDEQAATVRAAGARWVTDFAPQRAVLERADAVITHGGLNTVMDAIATRTPMLVMPIAFDQPGVAARVRHAEIGVVVQPQIANAKGIAAKLAMLLNNPGMAARLDALAGALTRAGGCKRAADIIEAAVTGAAPSVSEFSRVRPFSAQTLESVA